MFSFNICIALLLLSLLFWWASSWLAAPIAAVDIDAEPIIEANELLECCCCCCCCCCWIKRFWSSGEIVDMGGVVLLLAPMPTPSGLMPGISQMDCAFAFEVLPIMDGSIIFGSCSTFVWLFEDDVEPALGILLLAMFELPSDLELFVFTDIWLTKASCWLRMSCIILVIVFGANWFIVFCCNCNCCNCCKMRPKLFDEMLLIFCVSSFRSKLKFCGKYCNCCICCSICSCCKTCCCCCCCCWWCCEVAVMNGMGPQFLMNMAKGKNFSSKPRLIMRFDEK